MILHEFAVEPRVLSDWKTFKYVMEKFGFPQGRVISRFPKKWERQVIEILKPKLQDIHIEKLVELLKKYKHDRLINSHRSFEGNKSWKDNVIREHEIKPFHKIIVASPYEHTDIVCIDDADESHFNVPHEAKILMEPKIIADYIELLLNNSTKIRFIDPHFDPSRPKWWKLITEVLSRLKKNGRIPEIQYHINDPNGKPDDKYFELIKNNSPKNIIKDYTVTFFRWSNSEVPREFHARYILTDVSGVGIDYGLDQGQPGYRTDIRMLDETIWKETWDMYEKESSPYKFIDAIKTIGQVEI